MTRRHDNRRASTGIPGLDETVDGLRLGDNVVWQVDSVDDFDAVVSPFVGRARADGRRLVYVRFGVRPPMTRATDVDVRLIDPSVGFERFAVRVRETLTEIGPLGFYVFDPLADLHAHWQSDLMVMTFFKITCPYLFELDTIAYFALVRGEHTEATVAGIRETTQLLLDLHRIDDDLYVHPHKVWQRHAPGMFFPHRLEGGTAISVTSSGATTQLFARLARRRSPEEPWQRRIDEAWNALESGSAEAQEAARERMLSMVVGNRGRMADLCRRHLTLTDLLAVASREIGTGSVGGKAVGMLAARAILEHDPAGRFAHHLEPHDSFYVGSDVFMSFLAVNGWWPLWTDVRRDDGAAAARLHQLIPSGEFAHPIRQQLLTMIEYFGQAPIIVRSSSLLEDNFGNAFAGTYDSVFRANQGSPDERLAAFESAVKEVYASVVRPEAMRYRADRGLTQHDEQMAVLVQRVSGDHHSGWFLPALAGVANSSSPYVWRADQADQGMARLVVGLGTRAVDRTGHDYARIVSLADPLASPVSADDVGRYSQHRVDVIDLAADAVVEVPLPRVREAAPGLPWPAFVSPDRGAAQRLRDLGRSGPTPDVVDLAGLLGATGVPALLRDMLATLAEAYDYPVDIELTLNPDRDGGYVVNLVQCRPLQTRGLGTRGGTAPVVDADRCLVATRGDFMGGNAHLTVDLVVMVRPEVYLGLGETDRYRVARQLGVLNRRLGRATAVLIGPGRWGTSMASLGVPAPFTDLNRFVALVETTYTHGGFRPELSYGSHFFQELVETGTFYAAVFEDRSGVVFRPEVVLALPNVHLQLDPAAGDLASVIHVARVPDLVLVSDIPTQTFVLQPEPSDPVALSGSEGSTSEGSVSEHSGEATRG